MHSWHNRFAVFRIAPPTAKDPKTLAAPDISKVSVKALSGAAEPIAVDVTMGEAVETMIEISAGVSTTDEPGDETDKCRRIPLS